MAKEFMLPELGENIHAADVLKVLVAKGDTVQVDQPVLEIETDKATIEVPASIGGKIKDIFVKDGDKIKVGQVVFILEAEGETDSAPEPVVTATAPARVIPTTNSVNMLEEAPQAAMVDGIIEMQLPDLGENIHAADVLKVLVKAGDTINSDDPVLEIETDKATIEVPSTVSGIVTEVYIKEGAKATVGQVILKVSSRQAEPVAAPVTPAAKAAVAEVKLVLSQPVAPAPPRQGFIPIDTQPGILDNPAPAAPSVRRLARELGVDVNRIPGTGPNSRITLDDVKAYVKSLNLEQKTAVAAVQVSAVGVKAEPLPDFSKFGEIERSAMSNVRAKTAEHLSYAWAAVPHVTQFDKADITDLEKLRKQFSPAVEAKGGKLTVTAILIKVMAAAMKNFPQFNASVDMESKEIVYKKYCNIGVAVDTERGLIVPVLRNADKLNIAEISAELNKISEKARTRKISPDDLQGGCITISNLGGIGGTFFTPIVNTPEVAILGVSRGAYEPVYRNGEFIPRMMLPLSLSYDHRIIDGADAIRFLRWVIEALEQPMKLLIEG
ncbi:MAG: dihydrolipoyllysine-residue acetyltransferase [Ignavibacteriales bacterium]|nr:dihydrolipoyllysine-residue acetyltransferase [Ignavibacteriales bacterium]